MSLQVFIVHKIATNKAKLSSHFFLSSSVEPGWHDVSWNCIIKVERVISIDSCSWLIFHNCEEKTEGFCSNGSICGVPFNTQFYYTLCRQTYNKAEVG